MVDKENYDRASESNNLMNAISDQEREIAQNCLREFNRKNYIACLQCLNKLDNRISDIKVINNKAVVEFHKNDFKKIETFQKSITVLCNQFHIKLDHPDDVDYCIIHFNQAIILYHQRKYTEAIMVMDRVYKFIEPMDDSLAKQVSLLAIELQLCLRQPEKALSLISYLENQLLGIGNPTGMKVLEKSPKEKEKKSQPPVQNCNDPIVEEFRKKLRKYKVRCHLMKRSLSNAAAELQLMNKNKGNTEGMFMAANFEYLKGNIQESLKILSSIPKDSLSFLEHGESSMVMFYNNMGILHHTVGKFHLACHYFQQALKEDIAVTSKIQNENDKPLYTLGGSRYHELMYNLGISLLHAKKPSQAFDCLINAVRRYHRNSRLWLRLAECCILSHKESNEIDFDMARIKKEIIVDITGPREKQKIVVAANLSKDRKYSSESQSYAVPVPSLEFAMLCLRNALLLLPTTDTGCNAVPLLLIPGVTPPAPPPGPGPAPSSPLTPDGIVALKNSILCAGAYVAICLGDYILALEYSTELLGQPKIAGGHKLLGHLYTAESLVLLNKINEAIEHLNPEKIEDIEFSIQDSREMNNFKAKPSARWSPNNLTSARAVLQYNIAVCKTLKGQLLEAEEILKNIWQQYTSLKVAIPVHVIMLVLYIELQLGNTDRARHLLKQYCV